MFTLLFKWIVSFFTADKIGCLVRKLLLGAGYSVAKEILDTENQKIAYEFVKELNLRTDLTNIQKAGVFNKQMLAWAAKLGKVIAESSINCLRELAVNAIKAELAAAKAGNQLKNNLDSLSGVSCIN